MELDRIVRELFPVVSARQLAYLHAVLDAAENPDPRLVRERGGGKGGHSHVRISPYFWGGRWEGALEPLFSACGSSYKAGVPARRAGRLGGWLAEGLHYCRRNCGSRSA